MNEGFSIKKITGRICSELGVLFFNKKSFYLRRNRYILRALDICNGLCFLGSHAKDCPVRFLDSNYTIRLFSKIAVCTVTIRSRSNTTSLIGK
jgi:hypothetical protein